MRLALVALSLLLAGCDLVIPLDGPDGCSRGDVLADDFEGDKLAPIWRVLETTSNNKLFVENGQARLEVKDNTTAAAFESVPFVDFRGSTFTVEVATSGAFGPGRDSFVQLDLQAPSFVWNVAPQAVRGEAIALRLDNDQMQAGLYDAGSYTSSGNLTVAATPKVWRIASEGDDVVWSFSDDGTRFTELNRRTLDVGLVRPRMLVYEGASGPFEATFDRFNGGGVATGAVCSSSVLTDTFDAPLDPDVWSESGSVSCHFEVTGGELVMVLDPIGPTTECFLGTGTIYDLYRGGIAIQLNADPTAGHIVHLAVETATEIAEFRVALDPDLGTTQLSAFGTVSPANYVQKTYDPTGAHKFVRLRAVRDSIGEQLLFEASRDGKTYDLLGKTPDFAGLDRVRFRIKVDGNQSPAGALTIQGVNAP